MINQTEQRIQYLERDIADYEKNLRNFASGRVTPRRGEVDANKRELAQCRRRLTQLRAAAQNNGSNNEL